MLSKFLSAISLLALSGASLLAQGTRLTGPGSGFVFDDQARSIRWIVGVPGAAYLGAAVADGLDLAAVSPDSRLAVAVKSGKLYLVRLEGAEAAWGTLEEEAGAVDKIAWSVDSTAVVVSGGGLRIWRNLVETPARVVLTGVDGANWLAFAVEPAGDAVLAAAQGGVYRLTGGEPRLITALESPSGVALSAAGVAYVTDRAGKQLLAIRNWKDSAEVSIVAGASQGIDDPVAVAIGADGRSVLVAGASSRMLLEIDPDTGAVGRSWSLEFEPARLDRLAQGLYGLNRRTGASDPLQVLTSGPHASVFFIPAGSAPLSEAGSQEE